MYAGKKTNLVISNIAKTFKALCDYADFTVSPLPKQLPTGEAPSQPVNEQEDEQVVSATKQDRSLDPLRALQVSALQYHINIVLPDTRDQAVYDAIFKSLREHLG
jgi:hypothetical protein